MASAYLELEMDGTGMLPRDFLRAEDLSVLQGKPMVAEKDPKFKDMACFNAAVAGLCSCGMAWLLSPSVCFVDSMYRGAYLKLTDEAVEFSQPTPSACVLGKTKRTVRLENITDVTVEDNCGLRICGLKEVIVQTAGTGGVGDAANIRGVQATFLREPELWKDAIDHAHRLKKQMMGAPTQALMPRKVRGEVMERGMTAKLEGLQQLQLEGLLTSEEAQSVKVALLMHEEDLATKVLGVHALFKRGVLTRADCDAALDHMMKVLHFTPAKRPEAAPLLS